MYALVPFSFRFLFLLRCQVHIPGNMRALAVLSPCSRQLSHKRNSRVSPQCPMEYAGFEGHVVCRLYQLHLLLIVEGHGTGESIGHGGADPMRT